ncbi:MAG: YihY/virulence factor BrkB family protein [Desulfobulbaceae bacterium]|nr:YihY/virulence factor BrkB family protein [Desulfobulbaceae bacterium]
MQREFFRTNIHIRAAALTYSLALAMVPALALSTAIMKGVGSDAHIKEVLIRLVDQLEPPSSAVNGTTAEGLARLPGIGDATAESESRQRSLEEGAADEGYLHRGLDLVFEYVDKTNFAALGLIGVLGLLTIFILVLSSIEEAMNAIWHSQQRRSMLRRFMDYLALVIVLPLSLNIAVAVDAMLASDQLMGHLEQLIPSSWMLALLVKLSTFCFIALSLMGMYIFFPSAKVKTSAALAGAVFATLFWFIFQRLYIVLQIGVSKYNAIYGSFATIPLILICLNLGIIFILLGASLTHAIQYRNLYSSVTRELSPQRQLQLAFDILTIVYHNFSRRIPSTIHLLQESLPASRPRDIEQIVAVLISGQILQQSHDNIDMVMPVTSAEQLTGSEVMTLILGNESLTTPGGILAGKVLRAAESSLEGNLLEAVNQVTFDGGQKAA